MSNVLTKPRPEDGVQKKAAYAKARADIEDYAAEEECPRYERTIEGVRAVLHDLDQNRANTPECRVVLGLAGGRRT